MTFNKGLICDEFTFLTLCCREKIEEATGARLNMKDEVDRDSKERTVVIRGAAQSAQQAEVMVHRIVAEQPEIISEVIRVPQKALGRIIGG